MGLYTPFVQEQGPTRHRPMAHPVVFRYISYFTKLAEHAVHRLRRCPGWDMFVLVCSVRGQSVTPLMGGDKTMARLTLCKHQKVFLLLFWGDRSVCGSIGLCAFEKVDLKRYDSCGQKLQSLKVAKFPIHPVTKLPGYQVIKLPSYQVTKLPSYHVTKLPSYQVTKLPSY